MTRERPVRLQEGDYPQSKERGLRRNETCRHLDLELPVSACDEINFCCLNLPICGILLWQLEQTNYCDKAVDFSSCSLQFHGKQISKDTERQSFMTGGGVCCYKITNVNLGVREGSQGKRYTGWRLSRSNKARKRVDMCFRKRIQTRMCAEPRGQVGEHLALLQVPLCIFTDSFRALSIILWLKYPHTSSRLMQAPKVFFCWFHSYSILPCPTTTTRRAFKNPN